MTSAAREVAVVVGAPGRSRTCDPPTKVLDLLTGDACIFSYFDPRALIVIASPAIGDALPELPGKTSRPAALGPCPNEARQMLAHLYDSASSANGSDQTGGGGSRETRNRPLARLRRTTAPLGEQATSPRERAGANRHRQPPPKPTARSLTPSSRSIPKARSFPSIQPAERLLGHEAAAVLGKAVERLGA